MTQYSNMTHEEFIAYLHEYTIDCCHPQICEEAAERLKGAALAVEKQTPKRPKRETRILHSCPTCGKTFTASYVIYNNYCNKCGQALSFDA